MDNFTSRFQYDMVTDEIHLYPASFFFVYYLVHEATRYINFSIYEKFKSLWFHWDRIN